MIEVIPILIVDPKKQSVQRLAIENNDVFRSLHELLDLPMLDDNGQPSLEVSSLNDSLCAFYAKGSEVRTRREIRAHHWEHTPSKLRFTDLSIIVGVNFSQGGYSGVPIGYDGEQFINSIKFHAAVANKVFISLEGAL